MTYRYCSLFTGIGGFDLAADALGLEYVFGSEINKFAVQTYEANFGRSVFGDIRTISPASIPDHDILLGGFPCQDLSLAGKRKGITGEKSCLFFEIPPILKAKQPAIFLLENVKGLLHDQQSLMIVLSELDKAGYRVSYKVLNSKYFGVPQNRERLYFIIFRED
jgi:DNA (cytosine-5)-methyltransferase 1